MSLRATTGESQLAYGLSRKNGPGQLLQVSAPLVIQLSNLAGLALPGGVFINRPDKADWLLSVPGNCVFNGTNENGNLGLRLYNVYSDHVGAGMWVASSAVQTVLNRTPAWVGNLWEQCLIPWQQDMRMFVEFTYIANVFPASSNIELSLTPYQGS